MDPKIEEKLRGQFKEKSCKIALNKKIIQPVIEEFIDGHIENNTDFANQTISLYKMCEVKQQADGSSFVRINFLDPQLDIAHWTFDKGKSRLTLLYQIITGITCYTIPHQLKKTISQSLKNQQVNKCLQQIFRSDESNDTEDIETVNYTIFITKFLPKVINILKMFKIKAFLGYQFYYHCQHFNSDMLEMKVKFQMLLSSMIPLQEILDYSTHIQNLRKSTSEILEEYASYGDCSNFKWIMSGITFHDHFSYEDFKSTWINNIFKNIVYVESLDPSSQQPFKDWSQSLGKVMREIKEYKPTPSEIARDELQHRKPRILEVVTEINNFLSSDRKNISMGLLEVYIKNLKDSSDLLWEAARHGVDEKISGTSNKHLEELLIQLVNIQQQFKLDQERKEEKESFRPMDDHENAPRLDLPKLHSWENWLVWKQTSEEVLKDYQPISQKALILKSLMGMDKEMCKPLSSTEILTYLYKKYNDQSLLEIVLDDILTMKKAANDQQTYQNLSKWMVALQHVSNHNLQHKITTNFRRKALFCLLSREHYLYAVRKIIKYDTKLKKDHGIPDDPTDMSPSKKQDIETLRREFWISLMEKLLDISRKLTIMRQQGIAERKFAQGNQFQYHNPDIVDPDDDPDESDEPDESDDSENNEDYSDSHDNEDNEY